MVAESAQPAPVQPAKVEVAAAPESLPAVAEVVPSSKRQPSVRKKAGLLKPISKEESVSARRHYAEDIVREHALLAGASMAIPVPLIDTLASFAIQLKLVRRLCQLYSVDFTEHRLRALLAATVGGVSTGWAAGSALAAVSVASFFTSFVPSAVIASGLTYAIGQVFIAHFETDGTLSDLDPHYAAAEVIRHQAARQSR
ncbi:YcjF family protein [Chitinimonas lacunae]|uniref:YcjF family protein n=1 Tax=Chitinimonas lacunae TaxID=1963018 RepID=A0ABV8MLS7_9NEIS